MTTGEIMKNRRKALGLSAEYVAERLGVSPATIYRYEKGDIEKMPGRILDPIAKILHTTPAALMGWESLPQDDELSLTDQERQLLENYRDASEEIRQAAFTMLEVSAEAQRKNVDLTVSSAG